MSRWWNRGSCGIKALPDNLHGWEDFISSKFCGVYTGKNVLVSKSLELVEVYNAAAFQQDRCDKRVSLNLVGGLFVRN